MRSAIRSGRPAPGRIASSELDMKEATGPRLRLYLPLAGGVSGGSSGFVQFAVKTQILASQQLVDVNHLAVMEREMIHHLIDRLQSRDMVALDFVECAQFALGQPGENLRRLLHGFAQQRQ